MIVCICNNLNEKAIRNMTPEEFKKIRRCGTCKKYVKEIFDATKNSK